MEYVELSYKLSDGFTNFDGGDPVEMKTDLTIQQAHDKYSDILDCRLDHIKTCNTNGTFVDAPSHVYEEEYDICGIPLEKLIDLPFEVVQLKKGKKCFDAEDVKNVGEKNGAVLLCSEHYKKIGTPEYGVNPYLTPKAAQVLMDKGVVLIGTDAQLIDHIPYQMTKGMPTHKVILGQHAVVCEGLININKLIGKKGTFSAVPIRVDMSSMPVRAYAKIVE